jgi:hypothetical protein
MPSSNEGRLVHTIHFLGGGTYTRDEGEKIVVQNEFHGAYDISWLCVYGVEGNEISRWNMMLVMGVDWL